MSKTKNRILADLLDSIENAARESDPVSVRDVLGQIGTNSIMPAVLVVTILLVSPLSGIPGVPSFSAALVILLSAQALGGRRRLWLPEFMLRRSLKASRLIAMVAWLRRPCAFFDRLTRPRLMWLSGGIIRFGTLACCVVIPLGWPLLEILPLVSSLGAGTIALLVFGLFTRDGLFVIAGYLMIALTLSLGLFFLI
ncbi:exopolysaccharide biosynthesis protein [uncultured Sulfitobacter sp.]|uniref:exopolysaccharide biosynthesis protein n=1 Tax=uncultured Sulfitobacter sp. TaxID=191468 RepID=UPI002638BA40|nr:exopolysaccharide biosynthesis protein [uncultured Sulfitobacter sp.]